MIWRIKLDLMRHTIDYFAYRLLLIIDRMYFMQHVADQQILYKVSWSVFGNLFN